MTIFWMFFLHNQTGSAQTHRHVTHNRHRIQLLRASFAAVLEAQAVTCEFVGL